MAEVFRAVNVPAPEKSDSRVESLECYKTSEIMLGFYS